LFSEDENPAVSLEIIGTKFNGLPVFSSSP
jgi:hypothetical protein